MSPFGIQSVTNRLQTSINIAVPHIAEEFNLEDGVWHLILTF